MIAFFKIVIELVMDILETIVFVASIFIVTYLFILQPNRVSGASMVPTFIDSDYFLTSKITYKFREYERGDVVVFHSPKNWDSEYIKRIMGLPGDTVRISGNNLYINDRLIQEPYISPSTAVIEGGFLKEGQSATVPENYLFVMGDNRPRSSDSREFGPIKQKSIIGQVFYRYLPANKTGLIENPLPSSLRVSTDKAAKISDKSHGH